MPQHPGGAEYISDRLGKNIDEDFEDAEHTKSAKNIFNDLPLLGTVKDDSSSTGSGTTEEKNSTIEGAAGLDGFQLSDKFKFDYNRGIIWQIFIQKWSFEEYVQYINEPKLLVNPVRDIKMFDNAFLEYFSRTPWWVIPPAWLPYELYCLYTLYSSVEAGESNWLSILGMVVLGILYWTFAEYTLHRFVFHGEDTWLKTLPNNKFLWTTHFSIHGIHHAFPCDAYRLVFPPVVGYAIFSVVFHAPITMLF